MHFKGFSKLRCMDLFPDLKALYFEGNGCDSLLGLETNTELRCLYIHENAISKMEGLENLGKLANLNLCDNMITTIEGLSGCTNLDMAYFARNRIGRNGLDDIRGLLECPSITTLDLQHNKLDEPEILEEILVHMPKLAVLYLQGNKCTGKIKNYRKTIINRIPSLKYLDDRPVFEDDRRNAEAFARGGIEEERAERDRIQAEKRERDNRNRDNFNDMIRTARAEKKAADEAKKASDEAKKEAERAALPAESGATVEEVVEEVEESKSEPATVEIDTKAVEEDDAPPELEQVDADKLKEEQEAAQQSETAK